MLLLSNWWEIVLLENVSDFKITFSYGGIIPSLYFSCVPRNKKLLFWLKIYGYNDNAGENNSDNVDNNANNNDDDSTCIQEKLIWTGISESGLMNTQNP